VIAPEYAAEGLREYSYGLGAHTAVMQCLRDARQRVAIDPDRVFLTGHDMGADAAFDIGLSHPDEFAGIIPIAGLPDLYARFYLDNGSQTAWYIIRGELGRDSEKNPFSAWADRTFKGAKFDLIYVQFPGRGQDTYADEASRIFDWMDLHRRAEIPRNFEYKSLRQSDNQCHWVTALDLPRTVLLQAAGIDRIGSGDLMRLTAKINPGNSIVVQSPAKRHRVRLIDGVVDFDRRVSVSINGKSKYQSKFVSPDVLTLLEDFRWLGDRQRIAAAVLEF
jgi:pimeloyl-ACP methyl ester carboxylesterase